jgi:hypothetical protein
MCPEVTIQTYIKDSLKVAVFLKTEQKESYWFEFEKDGYYFKINLFKDYDPMDVHDVQCVLHTYRDDKKIEGYHGTANEVLDRIYYFIFAKKLIFR